MARLSRSELGALNRDRAQALDEIKRLVAELQAAKDEAEKLRAQLTENDLNAAHYITVRHNDRQVLAITYVNDSQLAAAAPMVLRALLEGVRVNARIQLAVTRVSGERLIFLGNP